jgi:hypothetical protein
MYRFKYRSTLESFMRRENKPVAKVRKKPLALSKMRRAKKNACYVLITCEEPTPDGRMHVEMTYEGDTVLAAYLLENAQSILDDQLLPTAAQK